MPVVETIINQEVMEIFRLLYNWTKYELASKLLPFLHIVIRCSIQKDFSNSFPCNSINLEYKSFDDWFINLIIIFSWEEITQNKSTTINLLKKKIVRRIYFDIPSRVISKYITLYFKLLIYFNKDKIINKIM